MQSYTAHAVTVFLLDDHDIVRRGLRDLLSSKRDIDVVGDTGSAADAVEAINRLRPDVMVLDLYLQEGSGIQVCRSVRSMAPSVRALLLTSAGEDEALAASVLAGASGYAVKLAHSLEIVDAIRTVGRGADLIDATARDRGAGMIRSTLDELRPPASDEERALLEAMLAGRSDDEIAADREISTSALSAQIVGVADRLLAARVRR